MGWHLINPLWWLQFTIKHRYLHFFVVGVTGVGLNLLITGGLTELHFGREHYFSAYVLGLTANLLYNFTLHTFVTFKTKGNHTRRLVTFLVYSLSMTYVQAQVVKRIVAWVGVDWYLVVIAATIFVFSVVTFLLFKFVLFKDQTSREDPAGNV